MGFIGIRARKTISGTNHKKQLSTTCENKSENQNSIFSLFLKHSHSCQCSKRARWLRWSTGPRPGLSSSCWAAAGHPGPSPAPTPASPKRQKTSQWWLTAKTGLYSLTAIFSWLLPVIWQSCGGSAVTLWSQGSWPTRWSGRQAVGTPSPESTAMGTHDKSVCSESASTGRITQSKYQYTHILINGLKRLKNSGLIVNCMVHYGTFQNIEMYSFIWVKELKQYFYF